MCVVVDSLGEDIMGILLRSLSCAGVHVYVSVCVFCFSYSLFHTCVC